VTGPKRRDDLGDQFFRNGRLSDVSRETDDLRAGFPGDLLGCGFRAGFIAAVDRHAAALACQHQGGGVAESA